MYTKKQFGVELKDKIVKEYDSNAIADWAYDVFLNYNDEKDANFLKLLLTLNKMELGEGFILTQQELNDIAENLILGKEINL